MSYLTEAFKQLNIIDEDLFPTDSEGLNKLKDFMKSDIDDEDLVVYDETANNEDEIKDSYNGKVILRCSVCKSYFFKEPKSVIIDAEAGLANVGDECCYCHNDMGYNVVGVVAPYAADVSKEERAEVAHEEPAEVTTEVNDADIKPEDVNESVKRINEETNYDKVMRVLNNMKKEEPIRESLDDINKKLDRSYGRFNLGFVYSLKNPLAFEKAVIEWAKAKSLYVFRTNGYVVSEDIVPKIDSATGKRIEPDIGKWFNNADILFIDNYNTISKEAMPYVLDYMNERQGHVIVTVPEGKISSLDAAAKGRLTWLYDNDLSESVNKVNEDLKDVSITTDDTKIQMTAEENGKVTVITEPVKDEVNTEEAEVVKPLSAADKDVIADNDGEDGEEVLDDTAIDFDEINDEDLDKLGEKYFTKVYDNVKSFKSTACKLDESGVTLEGKITFKSGKEAKTAFNFNEAYVTKTGKVKLIGENAQFAKNKKAFTLTGSLDNKKLVVESFTYNYRTKDEKTGKSTRLYGTVSK